MTTWGAFRAQQPAMAEAGRRLFYQFGVGLGFLATVRRDGGPRLHPIGPIIDEAGIYAFITSSPKLDDLRRDGRYALHSFPTQHNEDAFYVTGRAAAVDDEEIRARVLRTLSAEREWPAPPADWDFTNLIEFSLERCLLTITTGHGDSHPQHTVWKASGAF